MRSLLLAACVAGLTLGPAAAHDGVDHSSAAEAAAHRQAAAPVPAAFPAADLPLPFKIRPDFELIDQGDLQGDEGSGNE